MITGFYTAVLAVMLVGLLTGVILRRWKYKVGLGDGGIPQLIKAIRAHGNFVEVVPFLLIEMFILESQGGEEWAVHAFGITIIISRLMHAYGIYHRSGVSWGRTGGMVLTQGLLLVGAVGLILQFIS